MKRRNGLGYSRDKIKVNHNSKPPIGINIIESLQSFIQVVPAKQLNRFTHLLLHAFRRSPEEGGKMHLFKGDIKYLKRLHTFLNDIDTWYDQTDLQGKNEKPVDTE